MGLPSRNTNSRYRTPTRKAQSQYPDLSNLLSFNTQMISAAKLSPDAKLTPATACWGSLKSSIFQRTPSPLGCKSICVCGQGGAKQFKTATMQVCFLLGFRMRGDGEKAYDRPTYPGQHPGIKLFCTRSFLRNLRGNMAGSKIVCVVLNLRPVGIYLVSKPNHCGQSTC